MFVSSCVTADIADEISVQKAGAGEGGGGGGGGGSGGGATQKQSV